LRSLRPSGIRPKSPNKTLSIGPVAGRVVGVAPLVISVAELEADAGVGDTVGTGVVVGDPEGVEGVGEAVGDGRTQLVLVVQAVEIRGSRGLPNLQKRPLLST